MLLLRLRSALDVCHSFRPSWRWWWFDVRSSCCCRRFFRPHDDLGPGRCCSTRVQAIPRRTCKTPSFVYSSPRMKYQCFTIPKRLTFRNGTAFTTIFRGTTFHTKHSGYRFSSRFPTFAGDSLTSSLSLFQHCFFLLLHFMFTHKLPTSPRFFLFRL